MTPDGANKIIIYLRVYGIVKRPRECDIRALSIPHRRNEKKKSGEKALTIYYIYYYV